MDFGDVQIFCIEVMCENKCLKCFPKIKKKFVAVKKFPSRDGTPKQLHKHPDTMIMWTRVTPKVNCKNM